MDPGRSSTPSHGSQHAVHPLPRVKLPPTLELGPHQTLISSALDTPLEGCSILDPFALARVDTKNVTDHPSVSCRVVVAIGCRAVVTLVHGWIVFDWGIVCIMVMHSNDPAGAIVCWLKENVDRGSSVVTERVSDEQYGLERKSDSSKLTSVGWSQDCGLDFCSDNGCVEGWVGTHVVMDVCVGWAILLDDRHRAGSS